MIVLDRERARRRVLDLAAYIDAGPMPHLAAAESVGRLTAAGYTELSETDAWTLEPGKGYFAQRNASTVIAFRLGRRAPSSTGVNAIAAHLEPDLLLIDEVLAVGDAAFQSRCLERVHQLRASGTAFQPMIRRSTRVNRCPIKVSGS